MVQQYFVIHSMSIMIKNNTFNVSDYGINTNITTKEMISRMVKFHEEGKIKLRKLIEEQLLNVPDGQRIHLDKELLEELTKNISDVSVEEEEILKFFPLLLVFFSQEALYKTHPFFLLHAHKISFYLLYLLYLQILHLFRQGIQQLHQPQGMDLQSIFLD